MTPVEQAAMRAGRALAHPTVVDLSSANPGPIDFGLMRDSGVVACYFRGSKGRVSKSSDIDSKVYAYADAARLAGMVFGIYALGFARHGAEQDATVQATDAVRLSRMLGAELSVAVDWETEKGDERVTEHEFFDAIHAWADEAERLQDKAPLIYCGPGWWSLSKLRLRAVDLARCPLWSSDFEASREIGSPLPTPPFETLAMHQYAGSPTRTGRIGLCAGVGNGEPPNYVDLSRLLVPLDTLRV